MQIAGFDEQCQAALQQRDADWAESSAVATAVAGGPPRLAQATEHVARLQPHCSPPSSRQVLHPTFSINNSLVLHLRLMLDA